MSDTVYPATGLCVLYNESGQGIYQPMVMTDPIPLVNYKNLIFIHAIQLMS
jgi:hypothetical protein